MKHTLENNHAFLIYSYTVSSPFTFDYYRKLLVFCILPYFSFFKIFCDLHQWDYNLLHSIQISVFHSYFSSPEITVPSLNIQSYFVGSSLPFVTEGWFLSNSVTSLSMFIHHFLYVCVQVIFSEIYNL